MSDVDAEILLGAAWELGIRSFDTAPHYGAGLAERRLGRFLQQFAATEYQVSTKVGRLLTADPKVADGEFGFWGADKYRRSWDFSAAGVRQSLADSRERMGLEYFDVVYLHDPDEYAEAGTEEAWSQLLRLAATGEIGAAGLGTKSVRTAREMLQQAAAPTTWQLMLAGRYTLLDHSGADVLTQAERYGIKVVLAGVFNSGILADPERSPFYEYAQADEQVLLEVARLRELASAYQLPLRAVAMHFALRHTAVTQIAIGVESAAQLAELVTLLHLQIPDQLWDDIAATKAQPTE